MALAALVVAASALVPSHARSEDEAEARDVLGVSVRVKSPELVRIGGAKGSILRSRGETIPFFCADPKAFDRGEPCDIWFWAEPDPFSLDARGTPYVLRPARDGEKPLIVGARDPVAAPTEEEAKGALRCAKVTVYPQEKRRFDQLESHDVPSLSKLGKKGGYWFYAGEPGQLRLRFRVPGYEGPHRSVLRLQGIFARCEKPQASVTLTVKVEGRATQETTLTVGKTPNEGDDADLAIEKELLDPEKPNVVTLTLSVPGRILVQQASLEYARPAVLEEKASGAVYRTAGPTRFQVPAGVDPLFVDLTTGDLLANRDNAVASPMGHRILVCRRPQRPVLSPGEPWKTDSILRNDLLEKDTGADWVAIVPRGPTWRPRAERMRYVRALEPLAAHREKQGLRTKLVFLEDIEDTFQDGVYGPESIRSFLAHAKEHWSPAPRYVLLVGDAQRDARPDDRLAWVPTSLVDTYDNGGSASDYDLAPPGVAIGRFPVRTVEELQGLVEKTIAYETAPPAEAQKQLAFVTGEGHFGPMIDRAIEDLFARAISKRVPDAYDVDVTYANPTSIFFYPPDEFPKRVIERLSQGPLVFDYIGHGSQHNVDTVHWGSKRFPIFRREDAEKVACEKGRNPIVLITACWTGAFDEPERTVGEALVLNPRGAIAVFAASRVSHPFANALLSLELTRRLFEKAGEVDPAARPRLGERLRGALDDLSLESGGSEGKTVRTFAASMLGEPGLMERLVQDERHLYNLLGDPALVIRYAPLAKLHAPEKAHAGETIEVSVDGDAKDLKVTLERGRSLRKDLSGLEENVGPEALDDASVRTKILETYARANDFVIARATTEGGKARIVVPGDLAAGTYRIKAFASGSVASSLLVVEPKDAASDPKKKRYL